ncbi:Lsr2 family protein [Dactylosporangium sp. NPDC000521]|uniref:histone-like nucleoid-structuring protein Lsr2 n=1 Tax=Dactylosporangium sp. NPDC000521 TaxID=3363975 RepID=UPI00368BF49B
MKRTIHILHDDLDGGPADETVLFELDGSTYTIDLSAAHTAELRTTLAPYIRAAHIVQPPEPVRSSRTRGSQSRASRRAGDRGSRPQRRSDAAQRRAENTAIRAWGRAAGHDVRDLGRLNAALIAAYHRAAAASRSPQ